MILSQFDCVFLKKLVTSVLTSWRIIASVCIVTKIITRGMKIAVIATNGKAGKLIVKEAVERGLDVTAVVSHENQSIAHKPSLRMLRI